jgi:hypothetical protein
MRLCRYWQKLRSSFVQSEPRGFDNTPNVTGIGLFDKTAWRSSVADSGFASRYRALSVICQDSFFHAWYAPLMSQDHIHSYLKVLVTYHASTLLCPCWPLVIFDNQPKWDSFQLDRLGFLSASSKMLSALYVISHLNQHFGIASQQSLRSLLAYSYLQLA